MSLKACVYFGCENYVIDKVPSGLGNFTIFQFPKDNDQRFNLWMKLGKVSTKLPRSLLYMCSDHFDPKYISLNSRRRFLLSTAIPYDADETIANKSINEDDQLLDVEEDGSNGSFYVLLNEEMANENDIHREQNVEAQVGSNTLQNADDIQRGEVISEVGAGNERFYTLNSFAEQVNEDSTIHVGSSYRQKRKMLDSAKEANTPKNKILINNVQILTSREKPYHSIIAQKDIPASSSKLTPVKNTKSSNSKDNITSTTTNSSVQSTTDIDIDNLIDVNHVSTFIFKDIEYVQMSKEYYVEEKLKLIMKIKQYESVLRTMKQYVNALNLQ